MSEKISKTVYDNADMAMFSGHGVVDVVEYCDEFNIKFLMYMEINEDYGNLFKFIFEDNSSLFSGLDAAGNIHWYY